MYRKIFEVNVPYRMPGDPSLTGPFGQVVFPPNLAYFTTPPRIYGEEFTFVNAMLVKKEATPTSPVTITINVMTSNIYFPSVGMSMKFDGATGAFMGYGKLIGDSLDLEIVQSMDGSLWSTKNAVLRELDPVSYGVINTINGDFFEIPDDQEFHGIVHPMVDRGRGIIVMAGYPANVDARYILVNDFSTGALIRRIWVSGPVAQIMQEDDRRCFVICTNGIMNVVDFTTGEVISTTRAPVADVHAAFGAGDVTYAWDFVLRRLLAFNFVDGAYNTPPLNADGSSSNTITGYYPVPLATNVTKPVPLKAPRKGRTVPLLVRAVGDAGEPIPSLPLSVAATSPGAIGSGSVITNSFGYATINLTGTEAGLSNVTVTASVDDGASGVVIGGGTGGGTGDGSEGGPGIDPVAPTLSAAAATQTGATTATGTVSTNQGNGSLYTLFSTSTIATASDVKAGQVQAVTVTGMQNVSIAGLTAGTTYYPHYLHRNSAGLESAVSTGASFMTAADGSGTGTGGGTSDQSAQPVAVGSQIALLSAENTSTSTGTNMPFTIGHAFRAGHLPATGAGISLHLPDGTQIDSQLIVKALHGDGSVRHAIISGMVPSIPGSATVPLSMKRATASAAGSAVALPASLPSIALSISGTTWTAAPTGSTPHDTWFAGPVASDYIFNMPFVNGSGNAHPTLTAQFSVRAFKTGHVRVDAVVEHTKAYASTADITYNATISANGATVYAKTSLVHTPCARWHKQFWYGTAPALHVKHDTAYLIASRAVPNYDQSIPVSEMALADFAAKLSTYDFGPMGFGILNPAMGTTGGRPDIGLMPNTHAATVLSMDKRALAITLASADTGGSWAGCRRDDSNGPGRGYPLSVRNFPYATILGGGSDGINPSTGKNEHLPSLSTATHGSIDSSHQPGLFYLPYLLTGDLFYLEGLQFWNAFNIYQSNPGYRLREQGLISPDQVRGQGWSLRTLAECAYVTPDDHPCKADYLYWIDTNINWYNAHYIDGNDNQLGIITGSAFAYNNGRGMAPWQDDFFTSAVAHAVELLGHEGAKRLLYWKAKFPISRFVGAGTCIQEAATYELNARDSATSPYYTTIGQCMDATISAQIRSYPCNSAGRLALMSSKCLPGDIDGYPDSPEGYPSNLQPGLSGAVDSGYPGGATAWTMFAARPTKPDYGREPQFSIVPR